MSGNGSPVSAPAELVEFRTEHHEQVRAVFDSAVAGSADAALLEQLSTEFPRKGEALRAAVAAFRDLLRIEHRPDRFERLLRAWSAKVATALRSSEFVTAGHWMRALTENPVFSTDFAIQVNEAVQELSSQELLDEMVRNLVEAKNPPGAGPLLAAWGQPLVEYLIGGMVVDEPPVHRKHLTEYLGMAGRNDVRLLTPWLSDPRWFIVRNVATAVGKAGRPSALPSLQAALDHEDDRVRVEVIRAVAALEGEEAIAVLIGSLHDSSQLVRNAAVSLLRATPGDDVIEQVAAYLGRGTAEPGDARRLVKIIFERTSPAATEALAALASKRSKAGKSVREAARAALGVRS